ncbi:hypothetical protein KIPB_012910, partial [Kipferlia bialata]|eukprot:g12910.t1
MDLTPLLECPLLPSAPLPLSAPIPWLDTGSNTQPFTPTLTGITGKTLVSVVLDEISLTVLGLAEYNCVTCEWSVFMQPPETARTIPTVTDKACIVGGTMYARLRGQLLSVPLSRPPTESQVTTTLYPIALSNQPELCRDNQYIALPTAAGTRRLRVTTLLSVLGGSGITSTTIGDRKTVGECVGRACVSGVVCGEKGCYSVYGGVWSPMRMGDTDTPSGTKVSASSKRVGMGDPLTTIEAVHPLLDRSYSGVCVRGVSLVDTLADRRVDGWTLSECTLSDISGATLTNCTLNGCNLTRSDMSGCTIQKCVFRRCNLSGTTSTKGATLISVTFKECGTTGMRLRGCNLVGKNQGLPLLDKTNRDWTADDFKGAEVSLWDMTGGTMTRCDLTAIEGLSVEHISSLTSLKQCNMSGLNLQGVSFAHTDISRSDLSHADLSGCCMLHATVARCDFRGTDLSGAQGVTLNHLESAKCVDGVQFGSMNMRGWALTELGVS